MIGWFASLLSSIILITHSNQNSRLLDFADAYGHSQHTRARTRYAKYRTEDSCDEARNWMDFVLNVRGDTAHFRRKSRVTQWTKLLCLGACIYGLTPICHGPCVDPTTFTHQANCLCFCCSTGKFTCCKEAALTTIHASNGYFGANMMSVEGYCFDCNEGNYCHRHCSVPQNVQDCQNTWAQKYQLCCSCLINKVLVDRCNMYPENGAELTDDCCNNDDEYEDDTFKKQPLRRVRINETMH